MRCSADSFFGTLHAQGWQPGEKLCESVLNGVFTLDEVESMLLEAAVAKAGGNLSSAARLLGITRPQLAYRLKRMKEADEAAQKAVALLGVLAATAIAASAIPAWRAGRIDPAVTLRAE